MGLGWTLLQKKCTNWGWCMKYWSSKVFLARNLARCLVSQHCERLERFLVSRLCETRNLASRKITVETMRDSTLEFSLSFGRGARTTTLGGIRNSRVLFATCITYRFLRRVFFSGSDCKTILECYFAQHLELCVPLLRYYWL